MQGYNRDARDGVRISDTKNIESGLEVFAIKTGIYPDAENPTTITASGTIIGYEGYYGDNASRAININKTPTDPLDNEKYVYLTNQAKTSYQLMIFMEGGLQSSLVNQTYATDYTKRTPKVLGKNLGILLDTSNNPVTGSGIVDIINTTNTYKVFISNMRNITGTGKSLTPLQMWYQKGGDLTSPKTCPAGFISVPGNEEFNQPGFCVAQYEMSYSDGDTPTSTVGGVDWNTVKYISGKVPTSIAGKYPIADITQQQAIDSCKSMGVGYHLITNNEWMTVARDAEQQAQNWSGGVVGISNIYNGVSNSAMGCLGQTNTIYTSLTRNWATKTGGGFGNATCDTKRQLKLSNGQTIWDLSGNVWEHVNGANTIDGSNYNTMQAQVCGRTNATWVWNSFYGDDGIQACNFSNGYTYGNIGPKTPNLNANNGIGRILDYGGNTYTDRVLLRGAAADYGAYAGLFTILLSWDSATAARNTGFRCAF